MKLIGIAITDEKNLYGHIIDYNELVSIYSTNYKNIMPSFLNHDHSRDPISYTKMCGMLISNKMFALTISSNFIMTENEMKNVKSIYNNFINNLINKNWDKFNELILKLGDNLSNNYKKLFAYAATIEDENIISRMFPELLDKIDDDGLIDIKEFKDMIYPGVYKYKDFIIFAHRFFKRGCALENSFNNKLLEKLQIMSKNNLVNIKIRIDLDLIGLIGTEQYMLEYDYIWGPKFNDDLNSIPDGETVHEFKDEEKYMYGIDKVEILWKSRENEKIFESEEITNDSLNNSKVVFRNRYVHSIIKSDEINPFHLDGAIRQYTIDEHINRIDSRIIDNNNAEYIKLWRLDGKIEVNNWKELISTFYNENKLLGEYFNGNDEILNNIKYNTNVENNSVLKSPIAHISFLEKEVCENGYDFILYPQILYLDKYYYYYYEYPSYNLIKLLKNKKYNLKLYNALCLDFYNSGIINNVTIKCDSNNVKILEDTLYELYLKLYDDTKISYSILVNYKTKSVLYSFAGYVKDFIILNSSKINIPENEDDINNYIDILYRHLNSNYTESNDNISKYLNLNGTLSFQRNILNDEYKLTIDDKQVMIHLSKDIKKDNEEMNIALNVREAICSKCGKNYFECEHVSSKEENIYAEIKKFDNIGVFITNL
ncbi:hypothetical protein [uncultured Brachyspira sp.]|uniref:hypothetical protein n=1 Tax=uncultured Brachyspira sp. TaxID=221953 RepID=UPI00259281E3|nr:hypothetical protein [uncultured Brachyspira sp.]